MIDVLNEKFVPVELDCSARGGPPTDVPALDLMCRIWETNPWTRVSFGGEWVIDPTGEILLNAPPHKHLRNGVPLATKFKSSLERGYERFVRISSHPKGSARRRAAIEQVVAEVAEELRTKRSCWGDLDLFTKHTLDALWKGDTHLFEIKCSGALVHEDPKVRLQVARTLGNCAELYRAEGDGEDKIDYLGDQVAGMVDDDNPTVRRAAARALYQCAGLAVPELTGPELVSAATAMWAGL